MPISSIGASTPSLLSRVAILTSSGTWTHPDGASAGSPKTVYVILSGGGAGGAGGSTANPGATSTAAGSGLAGGGASGCVNEGFISVTGAVSYTIGAGGAGGTGGTNSTSGSTSTGNNGSAGGSTIFSGLTAIGGGLSNGYGFGPAGAVTGNVATTSFGAPYWSLGGSIGGASQYVTHNGGTGGAQSPSTNSKPPDNGFQTSYYFSAFSMNVYIYGQANYANGMSYNQVGLQFGGYSYYPFPGRSALVAGGGGESAWGQTSASTYTNTQGATGGSGSLGTGGTGGNQLYKTSGAVTGGVGGTGTGYGSGGGGGGGAIAIANALSTGGAGGAGSPGVVIVLY